MPTEQGPTNNMSIVVTSEPSGTVKLVEFVGTSEALAGLATKLNRAALGDDGDGVVIEVGGFLVVFRRRK